MNQLHAKDLIIRVWMMKSYEQSTILHRESPITVVVMTILNTGRKCVIKRCGGSSKSRMHR